MIDPRISVEAGEARDEYIIRCASAEAERDIAVARLDQLHRELESLRAFAREAGESFFADRLDAILHGGES